MDSSRSAGESPAACFASVRFDLRRLAEQARDRGFRYSPEANDELHVEVGGSNPLVFKNLDGEDAAIGVRSETATLHIGHKPTLPMI